MDLAPEEDLDEAAFSKTYGLSRTPVREIFQRLAGEGYVDIRENRGARAAPLTHATLRSFFLTAPMIYAAIGRLAVQNFRPQQLKNLTTTQRRFRKASESGDVLSMVMDNNRFHEIMGEMSSNAYLQPCLTRLLIDHARIGHTFYQPRNDDMRRRIHLAVEQHDAFIEAIRARDETAVVDLVFDHWELSRENMEIYVIPDEMAADFAGDTANKKQWRS